MDTTETIIQVDTIHHVTHVFDTVYHQTNIILFDTIKPDYINYYDKLLATQDDHFDYILVGIGIIVTALIILITVFNIMIARQTFKRDAKRIYKKQRLVNEAKLKKKFDLIDKQTEVNLLDVYSANLLTEKKKWIFLIAYRMRCLQIEISLGDQSQIIEITKSILVHLKRIRKETLIPKTKNFDLEKFQNIVNSIPSNINLENEKEEIIKELKKVNDSDK